MQPQSTANPPRPVKAAALLAALLAGALAIGGATPATDDPLTRPITGADGARWLEPQGSARVFGRTWYVGSKRLRQAVIDSGEGLVLIDAGLPEGFGQLKSQLAALGLDIRKVRAVLLTEPHYDHVGAVAALVRESGAKVYASQVTAEALRKGLSDARDPQFSSLIAFPPARRVHALRDSAQVTIGALRITALAMPGHTPGSMGYAWRACEGRNCRAMVFAASLNPLGTGDYRYAAHPELTGALRATLARLETLPCDVLLTGHPEHSGADLRIAAALAGKADAFASPGACRDMAAKYGTLLEAALRK